MGSERRKADEKTRPAPAQMGAPGRVYCNESCKPWEATERLRNFAHLDVDDIVFAERRSPVVTGLAALVPIGAYAKGTALDTGHDVQHANGDGGGHHEDERHGHATHGQDEKQYAAKNLCKCIHMIL